MLHTARRRMARASVAHAIRAEEWNALCCVQASFLSNGYKPKLTVVKGSPLRKQSRSSLCVCVCVSARARVCVQIINNIVYYFKADFC